MDPLPHRCAHLNQTNIIVQRLAVEAALSGNKEDVYEALMYDPLTSKVCTRQQIREMADEMFAALYDHMPQFN